jgi:phenylalanyl-tRNA synthetase beta subunit
MRPTLEDGLLQVLAKNPYLKKAAFFEIGTIFSGDLETTKIGLIIAGFKNTDDWQKNISKALGINVIFKPADTDKISQYDAKQGKINFVEIDFNACQIKQVGNVIKFPLGKMKLISKFPPLVRDFTVIAKEKSALEMITECQEKVPEILLGEIIDEYTNPETHQTATTIRLILQKMSGSFTDDEISVITKKLSDLLKIN